MTVDNNIEASSAPAGAGSRFLRGDMAAHVGWGLFLLVFLTGFDRYLALNGYLPVSGSALFFTVAVVILGAVVFAGISRTELRSQAADTLHFYRPFWLVFLSLAVLSIGYWFRRPDASWGDSTFLAQPFLVCAATALLPLFPGLRRNWKVYVQAAFVLYCMTVWADALWPGTFAERDWRPAGLAVNANAGALITIILAAPLLLDRWFGSNGLPSLLILVAAGSTVFLSLSRGGMLLYLALYCGYFLFRQSSPPKKLLEFFGAAALLLLIFLFSIGNFPAFQSIEAWDRLQYVASPQDWLSFRVGLHRPWRMTNVLSRYDELGKLPAPQPEMPPEPAKTQEKQEQSTPSSQSPAEPLDFTGHRNVVKVEDGRAYLESTRVVRFRNAWETIKASPLLGHGTKFNIAENIGAHNMYLAMWVDFGIVGALAYPALLLFAFIGFYRRRFWPGVCLAAAVAGAGAFSDNVFDWRPLFVLTGLLLGLSAGAAGETEQDAG